MRIIELRKKIIFNVAISAGSVALFCACILYNSHKNSQLKKESETIAIETSQIQSQAEELQSKTLDIKKYLAIWGNLDEKKKSTNGIKIDEINSLLSSNAIKYNISSPVIKVTLPETLSNGIFNTTTIITSFANIDLTFSALDDRRALSFVNDFTNSLPGYVVINSLEIKKDKSYSDEQLIAISTGKGSGLVEGKTTFSWYAFKDKKPKASEDPKSDSKDSNKPIKNDKN